MDKGGAENEPEPKKNNFGSATLNFLFLRVLYIFLIYIEFMLSMLINCGSTSLPSPELESFKSLFYMLEEFIISKRSNFTFLCFKPKRAI